MQTHGDQEVLHMCDMFRIRFSFAPPAPSLCSPAQIILTESLE